MRTLPTANGTPQLCQSIRTPRKTEFADDTTPAFAQPGNAAEKVMKLTGRRGVDTAIEAVGVPATFRLCQDIVAAGGNIANIGVHGI